MGLLATEKFKPILFIGLGGSGGKVVNQLAGRLKRHPNWERIQPLTHFVVIDTNKADLDSHRDVSPDCRFLISNFDARSYVERKFGRHELDPDPLVTSWFPEDYTPRSGESPGAGQIRMESRLKLYYNLENDRAGIRRKLRGILTEMTLRDNPWRDNEDRVVRVLIYGSVAGGTGSGGFIPIAYLLKRMILDAGWGRPELTGVLSLPTTFLDKVPQVLHGDIMANGYAALKELEFLTRQLSYQGGEDELEFVYDPGAQDPARRVIRTRPLSICYLIDRPDSISIQKYEHAVADASYLLLFSSLLGQQSAAYDNFEKRQRTLANGSFSTHFGTFGTALLQLPRRDILRYSSLRYVSRAFREYLCFGGDHPEFRVPYGDPAFERLDAEEKSRRIDDKFIAYVAHRVRIEEDADEKGVFTAIQSQKGPGDVDLRQAFTQRLAEIYGRLDELIDISEVEPQSISPGNANLSTPVSVLRREYAESRARVRSEYLEAQLADLRAGRLFAKFFADYSVNPIAQRLFLIRLMAEGFVTPFEDAEDGEYLKGEGVGRRDLDSPEVQEEKTRLEQELARTSEQGFFGRITDSENKAFHAAKRRALSTLNEWVQDHIDDLRRYFWRTFESELRQLGTTMLGSFRKVAEIADEQARLSEVRCERFRRDPASEPDSDIGEYYLDAEVLRDDRRKERLWDLFYTHNLDKGAYFEPQDIFSVVTGAFQPTRDVDGRPRSRDAGEIVGVVKEQLEAQALEVYAKALEDLGIDLASALVLEQRYIALLDDGADMDALRAQGTLDDTLRAVSPARVRKGIEDRFKRLGEECVLLSHVDESKDDDPTVVPAPVYYAGLSQRFSSDEDDSLARILGDVQPAVTLVQGWEDPDSMVLYRSLLGVPVYWFKNVELSFESAYKRVFNDPRRQYPLHISAEWEQPGSLPNLDPVEIKRAEEKRQEDNAVQAQAEARSVRIRRFTLCTLTGGIVHEDGAYRWSFVGASRALSDTRKGAFEAFQGLDSELRRDLEGEAEKAWTTRQVDRAGKERLKDDLASHALELRRLYTLAVADGRDAEKQFLAEERQVVDAMVAELSG